jgi:hypothetical protein
MERREFIAALVDAAAWPFVVRARPVVIVHPSIARSARVNKSAGAQAARTSDPLRILRSLSYTDFAARQHRRARRQRHRHLANDGTETTDFGEIAAGRTDGCVAAQASPALMENQAWT